MNTVIPHSNALFTKAKICFHENKLHQKSRGAWWLSGIDSDSGARGRGRNLPTYLPVLSVSLLCTQWVAKGLSFLHVDSEN